MVTAIFLAICVIFVIVIFVAVALKAERSNLPDEPWPNTDPAEFESQIEDELY